MTTAESVLRVLAEEGICLTRVLAAHVGKPAELILPSCRCLKRRGLIRSAEGVHELTDAGRALLAQGGKVPCGPGKGRAATSRKSLRQKAWRAMQMMELFDVEDILSVVSDGSEPYAENNLKAYCRALHRAGMLLRTRSGRYMVKVSARGPLAPSYNKVEWTVTDRNTGTVIDIRGVKP